MALRVSDERGGIPEEFAPKVTFIERIEPGRQIQLLVSRVFFS